MRDLGIILCCGCSFSCQEEPRHAGDRNEGSADHVKTFVGTAPDIEAWPYRYTLSKDGEVWRGEIEFVADGYSMPFDRLNVMESSEHHLVFSALFGGPGKALPCDWRMSFSSTLSGMEATLTAFNIEDFDPVMIRFEASNERRLPSEITTAWWSKQEARQGVGGQHATPPKVGD